MLADVQLLYIMIDCFVMDCNIDYSDTVEEVSRQSGADPIAQDVQPAVEQQTAETSASGTEEVSVIGSRSVAHPGRQERFQPLNQQQLMPIVNLVRRYL